MKRYLLLPFIVLLFSFKSSGDTDWFAGTWTGIGYQPNGYLDNWTIRFVGEPTTGVYTIEYPSLTCHGNWTLVSSNNHIAEFTELITDGKERCVERGRVVITRIDDDYITFSYFLEDSHVLSSYATLEREVVQ